MGQTMSDLGKKLTYDVIQVKINDKLFATQYERGAFTPVKLGSTYR